MLVISRKTGEHTIIGENIRLTVLAVNGNKIRLGLTAPTEVVIHRGEHLPKDQDARPQVERNENAEQD